MSPGFTARSMSALRTLIIPFAFDLISILVIGSTLPVATTDLTIVPRSTVASFDGVDIRRRAFQRRQAGRAAKDDERHRRADVQAFP